jgi:glycosyltransferase involved in cell wall biosynthesis
LHKISVIIPTIDRCYQYLPYLIKSLSVQSTAPYEVIIVVKKMDLKFIEKMCSGKGFKFTIIDQQMGAFTHALNIGKLAAKGDLIIFTDDDAIAPNDWIEKYIKLHKKFGPTVACVSSRDLLFNLNKRVVMPSYDDSILNHVYRKLVRPLYEHPISLLRQYTQGAYLTDKLNVAVGPMIPKHSCYSLPFRGVNMCFKRDLILDAKFPEHPKIRRGLGCEEYFGLQLFLKGYSMLYVPDNPVLHIIHESLSRPDKSKKAEVTCESEIMQSLYCELLGKKLAV